jgi:hypothetical protein
MAITVPNAKVRGLNDLVDKEMSEVLAIAEFSCSMFREGLQIAKETTPALYRGICSVEAMLVDLQ